MADSTSILANDSIVQGQGSQDIAANALFDVASPAMTGGRRASQTSGISFAFFGGKVRINGAVTSLSNAALTLTASSTNYVEMHPDTGVVSKNTTSFTPGYLPLYSLVVGSSTITSYTDQRTTYVLNDTLAKALSDANTTLTQAEAANAVLSFTGTLTATRDIVVPLVGNRQWTVYNGTGQSLRFIGASGTDITVATVKHAIVRSDGTNIVRVTADT